MSAGDDIAPLAERLRRRLSWSQLGVGAVSVLGLMFALGGLLEGLGLAERDEVLRDVGAVPLVVASLAVYAIASWGLGRVLARGDAALVPA